MVGITYKGRGRGECPVGGGGGTRGLGDGRDVDNRTVKRRK